MSTQAVNVGSEFENFLYGVHSQGFRNTRTFLGNIFSLLITLLEKFKEITFIPVNTD